MDKNCSSIATETAISRFRLGWSKELTVFVLADRKN